MRNYNYRKIRAYFFIIIFLLILRISELHAQPVDILQPSEETQETLSNELRNLDAIDRDMAIEKLNNPYTKTDSFLELGELRLRQGKLDEAERFFCMILNSNPDHLRANTGLAMVYYHRGQFGKTKVLFERLERLYPLSDKLKEEISRLRNRLKNTGEAGLKIREDNRGITEITTSAESFFPSYNFPDFSMRFKLENMDLKDNSGKINNRVVTSSVEYAVNRRTTFSASFVPEARSTGNEINGFTFHGVTGSEELNLAVLGGITGFRENVDAIRMGLTERYGTLTLFGGLNERAKISQSFTSSDISDGNTRRNFETDVLYFIFREGVPLLSLNCKLYQISYERDSDLNSQPYSYWAPSDYRGGRLALSWERGVGLRWWWGIEAHYVSNQFRSEGLSRTSENGAGCLLHLSRMMGNGRAYFEFSDSVRDYYRERSVAAFASFDI
ncbi:MAG: hypothetical protein HQM10_01465 [Candidatus Riflebacteria bacterium]|nr:hypothetical protein [Candidatus Riflebacteria bacterium]